MIVPFVDFKKSYKKIKMEVLRGIKRVLKDGDYILRDDVAVFESRFAKCLGVKYAIGVASGTDALLLSLKALGVGKGDEVITTGYTFWATVEAIINCEAKPVLADIKDDLLIDPEDIKKKITKRTKAIIPVHIGGAVCDMSEIMKIAKKYKLFVIEDSAQAFGSCGLTGDIACYSFYPAKVLGCYGDGGAIITNNKKLSDKIKLLRNHGGKPHPQFSGYNSRLDNIQAAILNVKLSHVSEEIRKRRDNGFCYNECLDLIGTKSENYQEYNVYINKRDELYEFLKKNGIETIKGDYTFPIKQPKNTIVANKHILRLPIWPTLTSRQQNYIIEKIKEFYGSY